MPPSTSSCLRQGPTHVTDTGRCPTPCPNPTEVARLGQLSLCCSQSGASPSSRACLVLIPALRLSRAAVCAATERSVCCSQDLSDLRTVSVLSPDRRGEPVVTELILPYLYLANEHRFFMAQSQVSYVVIVAWMSNSILESPSKRAVALAFFNMVGTVGYTGGS